jgi:hypothetical protein
MATSRRSKAKTKMPDLVALGIWEDYDKNQHLISEISTEYIINCLGANSRGGPAPVDPASRLEHRADLAWSDVHTIVGLN